MKKIVAYLLVITMFVTGGCTGLAAGVSNEQKRDQNELLTHRGSTGEVNSQFTVLYVPLDNRPLNYDNVISLSEIARVKLLMPPLELLGSLGENGGLDGPGDPHAVMRWLMEHAHQADAWVLSLDMLLYGGLAPSRSHQRSREEVLLDMQRLRQLLAENERNVPVYAFATIMRSAASSASPKQPGYFGDYGDHILSLSKLWDLADRKEASTEQLFELERVKGKIPPEVLNNYLQRRETNLIAMRQAVHLNAEGLVDYLVLGRDDTNPHSFSRVDLRRLQSDVRQRGLTDRVDSYPGADELGALLLARAVNKAGGRQPKVFVDWATLHGPGITALYEDISLEENVRLHVKSAGGRVVDNPEEADLVLAVNSPADKTLEAAMQPGVVDGSEHYQAFSIRINAWLDRGKPVAVADLAFANGADRALMEMPDNAEILPRLAGYAGCNTAGNSIGMALAHGLMYSEVGGSKTLHRAYLLTRLAEDWGFQAVVRPTIIKKGAFGAISAGSPLDEEAKQQLEAEITGRLNDFLTEHLDPAFGNKTRVTNTTLPWNRLFDVGITIEHG